MPATTRAEVMLVVLDELRITGYDHPAPTSNIGSWFKKINDHDEANAVPLKRVDLFVLNILHRVAGNPPISPAELIGGRYDTVDDLVEFLTP